jgi:hypothetical protein
VFGTGTKPNQRGVFAQRNQTNDQKQEKDKSELSNRSYQGRIMFRIQHLVRPVSSVTKRQQQRCMVTSSAFWQWTTQARPAWKSDKKEGLVAILVFGITGTTSAFLVRPTVEKVFGLKGSLLEGPNSYRVVSLLCLSPVYAVLLGIIGTLAGRHVFFAAQGAKIFGRFLPKSMSSKLLCSPAKRKLNV